MNKDQLHTLVFSSLRPNFTNLIKSLDRKGMVIKAGYNGGRLMVVKCDDGLFTIYDGAHNNYMINEELDLNELELDLNEIKEFEEHESGFVELKKPVNIDDLLNPKRFIISLKLFLGSYEKSSKHLITARTEKEAITKAFENECHGTPDYDEFPCKTACWDCGEYVYKVDSVKQVNQEEFDILAKYL